MRTYEDVWPIHIPRGARADDVVVSAAAEPERAALHAEPQRGKLVRNKLTRAGEGGGRRHRVPLSLERSDVRAEPRRICAVG
jgi:hypothetical protein